MTAFTVKSRAGTLSGAIATILRGAARVLLPIALAATPAIGHAADEPASIKVGYVDLINAQVLAKALHLTEKSVGIPVTWVKFGSGGDLNRAVAAGAIDFGGVGNPPATIGITRGLPYEGIFVLDELGPVESLVARPGIKSIKDLKGKTIATPFGSTSHYELIAALAGAGLNPAQEKILDMDPPDAFAAWTRKDIDAAYLWEPVLGRMVASGGKILMDSGTMARRGYPTWDVGVVMKDFAAKYPGVVVKYLKAECQAIDFWHQHPQEAAGLISKELNVPLAETAKEMTGTYMIPCHEQLTAAYLGTPAHKGKFVATLIATAKFLKSQNRLPDVKEDAVYAEFINPGFLQQAVKP
ncbi:MAG TPA: ABC transporter substrate-binding protein [Acetobacteraceae bacterium]|jgi:taurine transport system substrate-binding protein